MSTPTPSAQQLYNQYFPGNTGQSWTYGSVHGTETEQGTDVFLPAGAAVTLPTAATLAWTNGYQSVFTLADGTALSITHIIAAPLRIGQQLAAGAPIGTVAPLSATPPGYYSSATHIELGRYRSKLDAINWNFAATSDPVAWLASLGGTVAGKGSGNSGTDTAKADSTTGGYTGSAGAPTASSNGVVWNGPFGISIPVGHYLLIFGLAVLLIGVVLLLLAQLSKKAGVMPVPA